MRPLRGDPEQARRPRAGEIDEAQQRQPAGVDMIEHDRDERLHAGHAGRTCRIGLGLFLARVRRVVGAEHVDDALRNAVPDPGAMRRIAHRRIHLRARAEPLVASGRLQREMMRRGLDRSHILVTGEKLHLLRGRDVQHVDARAGLVRDRDQALRSP